jgi:hypothetical protein
MIDEDMTDDLSLVELMPVKEYPGKTIEQSNHFAMLLL